MATVEQTVLLGPQMDLHSGIHGSLRSDPPPGIQYFPRAARHWFLYPATTGLEGPTTPCQLPHLGEFVDFGPGPQVAHSARWPVLRRRAWIADTDDFGFPFLLGRHVLHPKFQGEETAAWPDRLWSEVRERTRRLLLAFAHPSCKAVLFRTRLALDEAREWLGRLDLEAPGQPFLDKCEVLYPAQRPIQRALVDDKWHSVSPLRIVFLGFDYEAKNGRLALRSLQRLRQRHPDLAIDYVGHVPEEDRPLTEGISFHGPLARTAALAILRDGHVLFHPTREESFGMVLLEAAAHGLAIVTAKGPRMAHVHEILGEQEALFLDRETVPEAAEETVFEATLESLVKDRLAARDLAFRAYERVVSGPLSLSRRNRRLREIYGQALAEPAGEALELADLRSGDEVTQPLSSGDLAAGIRDFTAAHGLSQFNFTVQVR